MAWNWLIKDGWRYKIMEILVSEQTYSHSFNSMRQSIDKHKRALTKLLLSKNEYTIQLTHDWCVWFVLFLWLNHSLKDLGHFLLSFGLIFKIGWFVFVCLFWGGSGFYSNVYLQVVLLSLELSSMKTSVHTNRINLQVMDQVIP